MLLTLFFVCLFVFCFFLFDCLGVYFLVDFDNICKFLNFLHFVYWSLQQTLNKSILWSHLVNISAQTWKIEKFTQKIFLILSQKTLFLYFKEWNFLAPRLKNVSREFCFLKIKTFLYFGDWNFLALRLKKFLYFGKRNFLAPRLKKLQRETFRDQKVKKSTLKKFLILREMELPDPSFKNVLYFRREVTTPENQEFLIFLLTFFVWWEKTFLI